MDDDRKKAMAEAVRRAIAEANEAMRLAAEVGISTKIEVMEVSSMRWNYPVITARTFLEV